MPRRRLRILSPAALARRNGLYKGVLGGSRGWLVVGGVFWGARFVRRTFGRNEQVVALEKLEPGQFVCIEAIKPPARRERKAKAS